MIYRWELLHFIVLHEIELESLPGKWLKYVSAVRWYWLQEVWWLVISRSCEIGYMSGESENHVVTLHTYQPRYCTSLDVSVEWPWTTRSGLWVTITKLEFQVESDLWGKRDELTLRPLFPEMSMLLNQGISPERCAWIQPLEKQLLQFSALRMTLVMKLNDNAKSLHPVISSQFTLPILPLCKDKNNLHASQSFVPLKQLLARIHYISAHHKNSMSLTRQVIWHIWGHETFLPFVKTNNDGYLNTNLMQGEIFMRLVTSTPLISGKDFTGKVSHLYI